MTTEISSWLSNEGYNAALRLSKQDIESERYPSRQYHLERIFHKETGVNEKSHIQGEIAGIEKLSGMEHYMRVGRSGVSIDQKHFLGAADTPEYLIQSSPTRTLVDFMQEDLVETAVNLHQIYIPWGREDGGIEESLKLAFDWVKNTDDSHYGFREYEKDKKSYPPFVQVHFQTASFYSSFVNSKSQTDLSINNFPVSFDPGTEDWDHDIRNLTIQEYDTLRRFPLRYRKRIDLRVQSTSLNLQNMTQMFWSGGENIKSKLCGADALTYELLKVYWLGLIRRAKYFSEHFSVHDF